MNKPEEVWIDGKIWEKHGEILSRRIQPEDLPALHAEEEAYFAKWHKKIADEWSTDPIQALAKQTVKTMEPQISAFAIELIGLNKTEEERTSIEAASKKYNVAVELLEAIKEYTYYLMVRVNRSNPLEKYLGDEDSDDYHGSDFEIEGFEKLKSLQESDNINYLPYFEGLISKTSPSSDDYLNVHWSKFPDMLYELSPDSLAMVPEIYSTKELIDDFLNGWLGWSVTFLAMMKFGFANYRGSQGDHLVYINDDGTEATYRAGYPYIPRLDEDSWFDFRKFAINSMASIIGVNQIKLQEIYFKSNPAESAWLYFVPDDFKDRITVENLTTWLKDDTLLDKEISEFFYDAIMEKRFWRSWGEETEAMLGLSNIRTYMSHLLFDLSGVQPFGDKYANQEED